MNKKYILVVDDEVNVAWTLQEGLASLPDCEVAIAANGEQAIQLFDQQVFDLVITDYKMPGMDGLSLAEYIQQRKLAAEVVLITAYADEYLREQASAVDVCCVLSKPVDFAAIRSLVVETLAI